MMNGSVMCPVPRVWDSSQRTRRRPIVDTELAQTPAGHSSRRNLGLAVTAALVTGVPSLLFSALLAVSACVGGPVGHSSVRGTACDIPGLGPWPYVMGAAVVSLLVVSRKAMRWRGSPRRLVRLAAAIPPGAMLTVVLLLHLLPRV